MSKGYKTATEAAADIQAKSAMKALLKEFHEEWKKHGEPHPNSNAYLALNRAFFYTKGYEKGIGYKMMFEDLEKSDV